MEAFLVSLSQLLLEEELDRSQGVKVVRLHILNIYF